MIELLEVLPLRGPQRILLEERNDLVAEIAEPLHAIPVHVFPMIVVSAISVDLSAPEESHQILEDVATRCTLSDSKFRTDLPSKGHLPAAIDGRAEATLSIYETHNPPNGREPFLLVFRTRQIVTVHVSTLERGSDMNEYRRDTRVFQHIAGCAPYRHRYGGQLPLPAKGIPTLGPL
jgi:hypothetical protein